MSGIGQEVKRRREARGWIQAKLAVEAGMAPSAVNQIENGKRRPSANSLEKLAEALEVEVADLFPKGQTPLPLERPPISRAEALELSDEEFKNLLGGVTYEEARGLRRELLDWMSDTKEGADRPTELRRMKAGGRIVTLTKWLRLIEEESRAEEEQARRVLSEDQAAELAPAS